MGARGSGLTLSFWQNCVCHLQTPFLGALSRIPGMDVRLIAPVAELDERRAHGWSSSPTDGITVTLAPPVGAIPSLLEPPGVSPDRHVRVFSGFGAYPLVEAALRQALGGATRSGVNGVFVEPRDHRGIRGMLRRLHTRLDAWRYAGALDFVLATGSLGRDWYAGGFGADRVFEFAYSVPDPGEPPCPREGAPEVDIVFLAQVCHRKALDVLLRALAVPMDRPWHLHVVGTGDTAAYEALASTLGLSGRVTFHGAMPYDQAMAFLAGKDLMVLPSRFDGWGVVVNEALLRGVPVVTSSACGSSSLVRGLLGDGWVFRSEDPEDLARALSRALPSLSDEQRRNVACRARSLCGAEAMADYFLEILEHVRSRSGPRPRPPWSRPAGASTSSSPCERRPRSSGS